MKKIMVILLAVLMTVSMAACGSAVQDKESSGNESSLRVVELTMDNWTEYFEVVSEEAVFKDLTGAQTPDRIYSIALKEGVVFSKKTMETVTFLFRYNMEKTYYTMDENGNILWGEVETMQQQDGRRDLFVGDPFPSELVNSNGGGATSERRYVNIPADVEITGISGKLYFD